MNGTTGEIEVEAGGHAVRETGSNLSRYYTSMTCRDEDGRGDVVFLRHRAGAAHGAREGGEDVVCVMFNRRKPGS